MIESLRLKGVRRYADETLQLREGLNVIEGPNNAGKTTLLLGVEYALFGRVGGLKQLHGMLQPKSKGFGVELLFQSRDGRRFELQRTHIKPPRARTKLTGHFTLKELAEDGDRYVLSTDFSNTEDELAAKIRKLTGIHRRIYDHVIHLRQGTITAILEGSTQLDKVLGVTAAAAAADELRMMVNERARQLGALDALAVSLEQHRAAEEEDSAWLARLREERAALEARKPEPPSVVAEVRVRGHAELGAAIASLIRAEAARAETSRERAALVGDASAHEAELHELEAQVAELRGKAPDREAREEDARRRAAATERRIGDLEGQRSRRQGLSGSENGRCETCGQPVDAGLVERELARIDEALEAAREDLRVIEEAEAALRLERRDARAALDALGDRARTAEQALRRHGALAEAQSRVDAERAAAEREVQQAMGTVGAAAAGLQLPASELAESLLARAERLHAMVERGAREATALQRERNATAAAELAAFGREVQRLREDERRVTERLERTQRERASTEQQIAALREGARNAELLQRLDGALRDLQQSLREQACESLATDALRFHHILSGSDDEITGLQIDPARYEVRVTASDIGREVPASAFQGGGQQLLLGLAFKLAVAKLVGPFDLLLLDEPTYGLDEARRDALMTRLMDLGVAKQVIVITHHRVATGAARRFLVQRKGKKSRVQVQPRAEAEASA